jgi:acyl-coenzyme A thioesterase PaaI-like protein
MQMDPETHFSLELGFSHDREEGRGRGRGQHVPELCVPGTEFPHASVLLTVADSVTGMLAGLATAPRISVTIDFRVRILRQPPFGPYESETRILRTGRTLTVGETIFDTPGAPSPFAIAMATFVASPRPADVRPEDFGRSMMRRERPLLSVPLGERVALQILEPGVGEVVLREDLTNSTGTIQGGVLGILGEMAAQTLVTAEGGRTFVVDDLDIRYLRASRVGPARSSARLLALDGDRATVAVEIRDTGMDDREVAHVIAQCRALERQD